MSFFNSRKALRAILFLPLVVLYNNCSPGINVDQELDSTDEGSESCQISSKPVESFVNLNPFASSGKNQILSLMGSGDSIHVLWVGNSLTDTPPDYGNYSLGPLPARVAPMLAELGITLTYDSAIRGGAEFSTHISLSSTMTKVGDPIYDAVNLQGYYQGFSSASAYVTAVDPLYQAAHSAGSSVLFEAVWEFKGDPGSPQYPTSALAVEGAASQLDNAFPVPVTRVWNDIKTQNTTLWNKLYSDATHQSVVGDYLNALIYTRFFSGQSVMGIAFIPSAVSALVNSSEITLMKNAVDLNITQFYQTPALSLPVLTLNSPSDLQVFQHTDQISFSASATSSTGTNISNNIQWHLGATLLHTGASFQRTLSAGRHEITVSVVSGQDEVERTFTVIVSGATNLAPTSSNTSLNAVAGEPFRQLNLASLAVDPDGTIDWSSLELDTSEFHGTAVTQDSRSESTINFDFSNNYIGSHVVRWRVRDNSGDYSNWASIQATSCP